MDPGDFLDQVGLALDVGPPRRHVDDPGVGIAVPQLLAEREPLRLVSPAVGVVRIDREEFQAAEDRELVARLEVEAGEFADSSRAMDQARAFETDLLPARAPG